MRNLFFIAIFLSLSLSAADAPPDPMELKSGWWDYFKGDKETLSTRIATVQEALQKTKESLDPKEHPDLIREIEKATLSLNMFLEKKDEEQDLVPAKLLLLDSYQMDQILEVARNLKRINFKIRELNDDLAREKKLVAEHQKNLDMLYVDYGTIPKGSPDRLETGISIITEKVDQAIVNREIKKHENGIAFLNKENERLKEELAWAKNNITFEGLSKEKLEQSVEEARKAYEQEKIELFKTEKTSFQSKKSGASTLVFSRLWNQKVITQSIQAEIAKLAVLLQEIKYHLFLVATGSEEGQISGMIASWKESLDESQVKISLWQESLREEVDKIGKEVASTATDGKEGEQRKLETSLSLHLEIDKATLLIQTLEQKIYDAHILIEKVEHYLVKEGGVLQNWTIAFEAALASMKDLFEDFANTKVFQVKERPITLINLIQALFIFLFVIFISRMIRMAIFSQKHLGKKLSSSDQFIISKTLHYILLIVGFFAALSWIGLDFTNLVIIASALGVGIGFGLQTMVNNIISGFMLLFQRNIKIGDIVELESSLIGRIAEINLQNTRIHSFEGIDVVVPNLSLTSQKVINWTLHDHCRRFRIPFGVAYGTDKEFVKKVVLEAVKKIPMTIHGDVRYPDAQVWMSGFGESTLDFELVVWVNLLVQSPYGNAKATYLWMLDSVLNEHKIHIPFPQMEVSIKERV